MAELASLRVLVVEDEMIVCMMLEDMLEKFGCTVVGPAADLDGALELARRAEMDAAILDINLDGTRSFPVADVLSERGIPFVLATGYSIRGIAPKLRRSTILGKPFDERELAAALASAIRDETGTAHQRKPAASAARRPRCEAALASGRCGGEQACHEASVERRPSS